MWLDVQLNLPHDKEIEVPLIYIYICLMLASLDRLTLDINVTRRILNKTHPSWSSYVQIKIIASSPVCSSTLTKQKNSYVVASRLEGTQRQWRRFPKTEKKLYFVKLFIFFSFLLPQKWQWSRSNSNLHRHSHSVRLYLKYTSWNYFFRAWLTCRIKKPYKISC